MESFISLENMISKISNTVRNESSLPSRMLKKYSSHSYSFRIIFKGVGSSQQLLQTVEVIDFSGKMVGILLRFSEKNQQAKMKTIHLKKTVRLLAFSISKVFCFSPVAFCVMFFQLFVDTCIIRCRVLADNSFHFVNSDRETLMT